jgi:cytochrome c oxidase cbb3-type subunit 3
LIICLLLVAACVPAGAATPATFPAQQRALGDPAVIARGGSLYAIHCRACHGVDLRGGDMGGPNLLRSQLVLNDNTGEAIGPVVLSGRIPAGGGTAMPALPLVADDLKAVAEYIHSIVFTAQPQGAPPAAKVELNLLVGNVRTGKSYFDAQCASCHSTTGDLAGLATRVPNVEQLQNSWVSGRPTGPRSAVRLQRYSSVTVKFANGESVSGALQRMDDFVVSLVTNDGEQRSYTRRSATPRITSVEVSDPMLPHRVLWTKLSDRNMHDVTAYLATLK